MRQPATTVRSIVVDMVQGFVFLAALRADDESLLSHHFHSHADDKSLLPHLILIHEVMIHLHYFCLSISLHLCSKRAMEIKRDAILQNTTQKHSDKNDGHDSIPINGTEPWQESDCARAMNDCSKNIRCAKLNWRVGHGLFH